MKKSLKKAIYIVVPLVVLLGAGAYAYVFYEPKPQYEYIVAQRSSLVQEVSVIGKVKPAKSVDLEFESSGKIRAVNVGVGDKVEAGDALATLDKKDLEAQVIEKEAALQVAKADLSQAVKNRDSMANTSTQTSLRVALDNATINLDNVTKKAEDDLNSDYSDALNALNEGFVQAQTSFSNFKKLQEKYFGGANSEDLGIVNAKNSLETKIYGSTTYNIKGTTTYVSVANTTRARGDVDAALVNLESTLAALRDGYLLLQTAINNNLNEVSTTDRDLAITESTSTSTDLSAISSSIKAISSQKITNTNTIATAQATLSTAQAAFPTDEDIAIKQSAVRQAEANLLIARANLSKSSIIAPFDGVITEIDYDRGETVNSGQSVISMISDSGYEIEANVTEVDISKVKIGDKAKVTLDAYGPGEVFEVVVSKINPGETIIDSVTTYKTTFQFNTADEKIRPNMTANVTIETARKDNVITVPQRAVSGVNGGRTVRVVRDEQIEVVPVELGLTGLNGSIEVLSGIREGDQVVTFMPR